jgi:hypothetical protein
MLSRTFPECVDNHYRGHPLGRWLFVVITLQKLALSLTHVFKLDVRQMAYPPAVTSPRTLHHALRSVVRSGR